MVVDTLPIYLSNPNDLISLPDVYFKVRDLVQQSAGTSEISQAIAFDPALTVRFLSIANSALFSPSSEISSVSRAVTLLGTQIVHDIVLASSVSDLFDGIPPEVIDTKTFWTQSVNTAMTRRAAASGRQKLHAAVSVWSSKSLYFLVVGRWRKLVSLSTK